MQSNLISEPRYAVAYEPCPKGQSQKYGYRLDQECNWEDLGCGCIFRPWRDGNSKVVEVTRRDGSITCFRAARLPVALDNAIKADTKGGFFGKK